MNALVKKEVRLLLPAFGAALALALFSAVITVRGGGENAAPELFLIGAMLLGTSAFGRELNLKTFPLLLAQPVERARVWRTKMGLLVAAVGLALVVWFVSSAWLSVDAAASWQIDDNGVFLLLASVVLVMGAVWLTLLLRHFMAAFWLSLLFPVAIATVIHIFGGGSWAIGTALAVYAATGFFAARRLFLRAQDTAWTGGVIAIGLRPMAQASENAQSREYRPWAALIKKEWQLGHATLLGMVGLLALHVIAAALRKYEHHLSRMTLTALEGVGFLWLAVPVVWGCQSVAEERKMGTMEGSLCLPVRRGAQWGLKLLLALLVGLVSAALCAGVEGWVNGWLPGFTVVSHFGMVSFLFLALAAAGFYGSTLTREIPQALAAATLVMAGAFFLGTGSSPDRNQILPLCIFYPIVGLAALWLSWGSFCQWPETRKMWRRNLIGMPLAMAAGWGLTAGVYQRAWESLTPVDAPHGLARISVLAPPIMDTFADGIAVVFPDGRLWSDSVDCRMRSSKLKQIVLGSRWESLEGDGFKAGTNWAQAVCAFPATLAIQRDGSLWISRLIQRLDDGEPERQRRTALARFGDETNWESIAQGSRVYLVKREGTLWVWIWKRGGLGEPARVGRDRDWSKVAFCAFEPVFWKRDGSAWVQAPTRGVVNETNMPLERCAAPMLNGLQWRSLAPGKNGIGAIGLREDGTLWNWDGWSPGVLSTMPAWTQRAAPKQVGTETDWAGIVSDYGDLLACKRNGTLWRLKKPFQFPPRVGADGWTMERLGTHDDWVGVGRADGRLIALAADGGLWQWPDISDRWQTPDSETGDQYLAPSRKPRLVENIFDTSASARSAAEEARQ